MRMVKNRLGGFVALLALSVMIAPAHGADDSKTREGAAQVESGAKQVGSGVENTAKGIGKTVTEGAETAGEKIKEAGRAAEPEAKSAWTKTQEAAVSFGHSVKTFFTKLFQ
ncbi:MAG TPA: hypothetical protein VEH80_03230 [Candidatus Bathyarchaeia archaeon]|nr:hypothetical protein [Candidatus Bathyarchaeia archaeon]